MAGAGPSPLYRAGSVVAIALGLALSAASVFFVDVLESRSAQAALDRQAHDHAAAIRLAVARGIALVESTGALFDSSDRVTRAQFRVFARRILEGNPAMQAAGWAPRVPAALRPAYEAAARRDVPGFEFNEIDASFRRIRAPRRDEHFPVYYVEARGTPRILGFDFASSASRHEAVSRARGSGRVVASERVLTVGTRFKQVAFLLVRPVYRGGSAPRDAAEREQGLVGVTFGLFIVEDLIASVLERFKDQAVHLALYDDSAPIEERFLSAWPSAGRAQQERGMHSAVRLEVAGRKWTVVLAPALPAQGAPSWRAWAAGGVCLLVFGLLALYFEAARKYARRIHRQAITDPLTGLYNRGYLWAFLQGELARARRSRNPVSAVMIDVDYFKDVNDRFGHAAGDRVLVALAALIRSNIRGSDLACRYGGEEFVLILPEASLHNARRRAEHLRMAARELRVEHGGETIGPITLSMGLALFPEDATHPETLLRCADHALYQAKQAGRDRVACYAPREAEAVVALRSAAG